MGLLNRFDLSSDMSRFLLGGLVIFLLFSVLLTIVAPQGGKRRGRDRRKVDDRFVSSDGELID